MWGTGGLGVLWMALFWLGVILLVVWAVRRLDEADTDDNRALAILEERYARGEIDAEELSTRRQLLTR